MNAEEFEKLVIECRQAQKLYFRTAKADPKKASALDRMKKAEKPIISEIRLIIKCRCKDNSKQNRREAFFLDVANMFDIQQQWMKYKYNDLQEKSIVAERKVDDWLTEFRNDREQQRREEAERQQLKLEI